MKKRSLVIAILFSVFSHIYAENEWETYMKNETPLSQRKKGKL